MIYSQIKAQYDCLLQGQNWMEISEPDGCKTGPCWCPSSLFSAAPEGEHGGRLGGVAACWPGGSRHPVPRRVPLIRQAEGAQRPQPNGAAGTDVSEASAREDNAQHKHFFLLDNLNVARECSQMKGFCSVACLRISHTWRILEMSLLQEMVCADCFHPCSAAAAVTCVWFSVPLACLACSAVPSPVREQPSNMKWKSIIFRNTHSLLFCLFSCKTFLLLFFNILNAKGANRQRFGYKEAVHWNKEEIM